MYPVLPMVYFHAALKNKASSSPPRPSFTFHVVHYLQDKGRFIIVLFSLNGKIIHFSRNHNSIS